MPTGKKAPSRVGTGSKAGVTKTLKTTVKNKATTSSKKKK
jgi:hypothetical protein